MAVTGEGFGIIKFTAASDASSGRKIVTYARWIGGTTAGHSCILKDGNGNVLFESEADGANFLDLMPIFRAVDGLDVDTLDSGSLYVYCI
jgi:hypothetical protein